MEQATASRLNWKERQGGPHLSADRSVVYSTWFLVDDTLERSMIRVRLDLLRSGGYTIYFWATYGWERQTDLPSVFESLDAAKRYCEVLIRMNADGRDHERDR